MGQLSPSTRYFPKFMAVGQNVAERLFGGEYNFAGGGTARDCKFPKIK